LAPDSTDLAPHRATLRPGGRPSAKRILVAEDDPDLRSLIAGALTEDGHEVVEAADGARSLELLDATLGGPDPSPGFDLIVSDVHMPGRSGLEVLAGLRHHPVAPPVVLITAFGDEQVHADARRLGAVAMLDKPFDLDDLRAVVRAALRR
jgi:DNA-binding response OmpR family regulator